MKLMIGKRAHRQSMRLAERATECQQPLNSAGQSSTSTSPPNGQRPLGQQPLVTLPASGITAPGEGLRSDVAGERPVRSADGL